VYEIEDGLQQNKIYHLIRAVMREEYLVVERETKKVDFNVL
jgi:negative regulator of sigma E activity